MCNEKKKTKQNDLRILNTCNFKELDRIKNIFQRYEIIL